MNFFRRLIAAVGATATAVTLAVLIPTYAWAADHPTLVAAGSEIARRRRTYSRGGIGCGAICCLLVVAIIVVVILLISRRRRGPRQP